MSDGFRLAIVQPRTIRPDEKANVDRAVSYAREAADQGAQVVAFPECYPGPYAGPVDYSATEALSAVAREYKIYIAYGYMEPVQAEADAQRATFYNVYEMIGPDGSAAFKYRKQIPSPADLQLANKESVPGDGFALVETPWGKVGTLICWEVFFPELCRTLAMQGADLVLFPTGGGLYDLAPAWRNLVQARATENLIYTACNVNLFGVEKGFSYVFSPEEGLGSLFEEGILIVDLDIDRLRYLREKKDSILFPQMHKTCPGLWGFNRPELYRPGV